MLLPGKIKVAVATVTKAHGIKGEMNIALTDMAEPDDDFAPGSCLIVEIEGLDVPFFVASSRPRGSESMLLTLDEVTTQQQAAAMTGLTLYVYADPDEVDAEGCQAGALTGYTIMDATTGRTIGRVERVEELTPGQWFFVMEDTGMLVPAADELVTDLDHEGRVITMALPEGLTEL